MSEAKQLGGMCSRCGWFACQCPAEPVIEVAPGVDTRPSRVYAREALAAELAEEEFPAVPALNHCPGCDEYGASHTSPSIEHPAIPTQPCREVCGSSEVWTPERGCKCHPGAVPAQEASRVNCTCESPCHLDCTDSSCGCLHHARNKATEPQAGAQATAMNKDEGSFLICIHCGKGVGEGIGEDCYAAEDTMHDFQDSRADMRAPTGMENLRDKLFRCEDCGFTGEITELDIAVHREKCALGATRPYNPTAEPQAGAQQVRNALQKGNDDTRTIRKELSGNDPWACVDCGRPQVPSQDADKAARFERFVRTIIAEYPDDDCDSDGQMMNWLGDRLIKADAHLATIKSYATEAAKTPITRESILDARDGEPDCDGACPCKACIGHIVIWLQEQGMGAMPKSIEMLESALNAQTQTALTQYDEMQGLCRLILAESGGGK